MRRKRMTTPVTCESEIAKWTEYRDKTLKQREELEKGGKGRTYSREHETLTRSIENAERLIKNYKAAILVRDV